MKNETLLELAAKWERESKQPETRDGSKDAEVSNALKDGVCHGLSSCARQLRDLVALLG